MLDAGKEVQTRFVRNGEKQACTRDRIAGCRVK